METIVNILALIALALSLIVTLKLYLKIQKKKINNGI